MFRRTIRFLSIASISIAAAACDGDGDLRDIDKTSALSTTRSHLRTHLVEGARASAFLNESHLLGSASCDLQMGETGTSTTSCTQEMVSESDMEAVADELAARVFVEENVEEETSDRIVLRLRPETVCVEDDGRRDAECARVLEQVPIRLEFTSREEDQFDVGVLVGEARLNPIDVSISRDRLAAELDLAAVKGSVELITAVTGEDADLPDTMVGRVGMALERLGAKELKATFSVLEAVDLGDGAGDARTAIHAEAAAPALQLHVNGDTEQLTVASSFAELLLTTPLGEVFDRVDGEDPDRTTSGSASVRLGALRGALAYDGARDDVTVTGLDTGDGLLVSVDGLPVFGLDLASERLRISEQGEDALIEATPAFAADMTLRFENVANRVEDEIPAWLAHEDLSLRLSGSPSASVLIAEDSNPGEGLSVDRVLKVLSGTLSLTSQSSDHDVTVEAGACLLEVDADLGTDPHPFASLSAGVCE